MTKYQTLHLMVNEYGKQFLGCKLTKLYFEGVKTQIHNGRSLEDIKVGLKLTKPKADVFELSLNKRQSTDPFKSNPENQRSEHYHTLATCDGLAKEVKMLKRLMDSQGENAQEKW